MEKILTYFKVITVSKNTNSFGLHGVILMSKKGISYELGINTMNLPKKGGMLAGYVNEKGDLISIPSVGYEIPRRLPNAPQNVIDEVWPLPTPKEEKEFKELKAELFGVEKFVTMTDEDADNPKWQRYDELMTKIQNKHAI